MKGEIGGGEGVGMDICQNSNNMGRDPKDRARLGNSKKGDGSEMRIAAFLPKILQFLNACKKPFQNICYSFFPSIHRFSVRQRNH